MSYLLKRCWTLDYRQFRKSCGKVWSLWLFTNGSFLWVRIRRPSYQPSRIFSSTFLRTHTTFTYLSVSSECSHFHSLTVCTTMCPLKTHGLKYWMNFQKLPTRSSTFKLLPDIHLRASRIDPSCTILNNVNTACLQLSSKHFSVFSGLKFSFPFATSYSEHRPIINSKLDSIPANFSIFPYICLIWTGTARAIAFWSSPLLLWAMSPFSHTLLCTQTHQQQATTGQLLKALMLLAVVPNSFRFKLKVITLIFALIYGQLRSPFG